MKFNMNSWEEKCVSFTKNKVGMSAEVDVTIQNGHIIANIKAINQKYENYKDELLDLMLKIANGAMIIMHQAFLCPYATEEDYETEKEHNEDVLAEHAEEYLKILVNQGKDTFLEVVYNQSMINQVCYQLSKMHYESGKWIQGNGAAWDGGLWRNKDGSVYSDLLGSVMSVIVGPDEQECIA